MSLATRILGLAVSFSVSATALGQGEPDFSWRRVARGGGPQLPSFGPDGAFFTANGRDCLLIRASDGKVIKTLPAPGFPADSECLFAVASPDGRFVALEFNPWHVQVLRTADWSMAADLQMSAFSAAFSPDGRALVLCSVWPGMGSRVFETETWTVQATSTGTCDFSSISISPDSLLVALKSGDYSLPSPRIFRISDGVDVTPLSGFGSPSYHWVLGNDWIALVAPDGLQITTLTDPSQRLATLSAPFAHEPVLSPDGRFIAAAFEDRHSSIGLWETGTFSSVAAWPVGGYSPDYISDLAFASDSLSLVSVMRGDKSIAINTWNIPEGTPRATLVQDSSITTELVFSPDGELTAAGFGNLGNIRLRRTNDGTLVQTLLTGAQVRSVSFSPDGRFLVSSGEGGMQSWSLPDGSRVQRLFEPASEIAISSAGMLAERTPGETKLRTVPDLNLLSTLPESGPLSFSPDGRQLLVGSNLFDVATGERLRTFPVRSPNIARYMPDNQTVVFACGFDFRCDESQRGFILSFDIASGQLVAIYGKLIGYEGYYLPALISSLAISPDGTLAQLSYVERHYESPIVIVRIWDARGDLLAIYDREVHHAVSLSYSPDGRYLGWRGSDGVFGVSPNPCANEACTPLFTVSRLYDNFMSLPVNPALWAAQAVSGRISRSETFDIGRLLLIPDPGAGDAQVAVKSIAAYSLLGSDAHVNVPEVVREGNVNNRFSIEMDDHNRLEWLYESGTLYAISLVAGTITRLAEIPYSSTEQYYRWRIRESNGTVYWDTAPRSGIWATHATAPTASLFSLQSVRLALRANTWDGGSLDPGRAAYERLNDWQ